MNFHHDVIAPVILGVTGILFFAVIGRYTARRLGQPSVLGEVIMGIIIGNVGYLLGNELIQVLREGTAVFDMVDRMLSGATLAQAGQATLAAANAGSVLHILAGPHGADYLKVAQTVDTFSRYGVIFMLFLVGLETSLHELRRSGREALQVSLIGVLVPFVLGMVVTRAFLPNLSLSEDLFVAATLVATSVGITARVLQDLGQLRSRPALVILGAAVIDDVLGLIMLAVVTGIVISGNVSLAEVGISIALSAVFFAAAFTLGPYFLNFTIWLVRHLDMVEAKMFTSFLFVMVLAWLANLIGLATIVGAFTAGVILHDGYFRHWGDQEHHQVCIKDLIAPLETILVPIFFVLMGIQVKLESFLHWNVLAVALGLILVAIVGKLVAGLGAARASNRMAVGLGMMPRGEVGLIFAALGKSLGVLGNGLFSSIVMMVVVTTLVTPPLLKLSLGTSSQKRDSESS
ncbi:MAG: cation:proton antiporter [Gammaproteobacteria bacterium]